MAVSVNKVYQTVLRLCNKEKRGFLTPKEFNLFADTAQMDIFEQYFFDLSQHKRRSGNSTEHADPRDIIEDKISHFQVPAFGANASPTSNFGDVIISAAFPDLYRITQVRALSQAQNKFYVAEEVTLQAMSSLENSKKTTFDEKFPIYAKYDINGQRIRIRPAPSQAGASVAISYIRRPYRPKWTYVIVADRPYYNASAADHQDFELHSSEYNNLVNKILMMAGVTIGNQAIAQAAAAEDNKSIQQEKL